MITYTFTLDVQSALEPDQEQELVGEAVTASERVLLTNRAVRWAVATQIESFDHSPAPTE